MPVKAKQASPSPKGEGRKLRRARNVLRRWQARLDSGEPYDSELNEHVRTEIEEGRFERACALILADKLRNS